MGLVVGIVVVAAGAAGVVLLLNGSDDAAHDPASDAAVRDDSDSSGVSNGAGGNDSVSVGTEVATTTLTPAAPTTVALPSTVPGRAVDVDEAWLLDRGDGEFDWGLTVRVPDGAETRGDVAVRVRLIGADDEVLDEIQRTLDGVSDRGATAVAGRLRESDGVPTRLDFDVTIGVAADELGLPDVLDTRAVERDGDELSGRIRSISPEELSDIAMVLVWREPSDAESGGGGATASSGLDAEPAPIIDVVVYEIDRIRPGVDAVFAIDLADLRTPDGLPDDVFWAPDR